MGEPEFESSRDLDSQALANAFENAKLKAERLAATMSCRLGDVLQVEERADFAGIVMAAGPAADAPELQRPKNKVRVTCRVRFAVN